MQTPRARGSVLVPRFAEDIDAALEWLALSPQVDATRLGVIGHSVRAGGALLSATRRADIRAVISNSAFAHPYEVMRRFLASNHIPLLWCGLVCVAARAARHWRAV